MRHIYIIFTTPTHTNVRIIRFVGTKPQYFNVFQTLRTLQKPIIIAFALPSLLRIIFHFIYIYIYIYIYSSSSSSSDSLSSSSFSFNHVIYLVTCIKTFILPSYSTDVSSAHATNASPGKISLSYKL